MCYRQLYVLYLCIYVFVYLCISLIILVNALPSSPNCFLLQSTHFPLTLLFASLGRNQVCIYAFIIINLCIYYNKTQIPFHNHLCHHHHPHQHQCSRCYHSHHNDPFRYQMPANVKKRAITAGLIGEQSDIFDPNIDSFPNI